MLVKPQASSLAKIKVVGVGGAGGNAINNMIQNYDIEGVEFIAVNTDAQALANSSAETKLQVGQEITRGLGSGGSPQIGKKAAEESVDMIHEHLAGADMVFITAGMGGGTGTGASPVIAGIAKNLGALTIAIVEKPFIFEGKKRMETALQGIDEIKDKVDTLIVIPNQKLFELGEKNLSFLEALRKVDDVLAQAVKSISQLINHTGMINLDFADIKSVMLNAGTALMGVGTAEGDGRASTATRAAIQSPLLEFSITGAKGVIFNIIGGKDLSITEVEEAAKVIQDEVHQDCNLVFGASIDPELGDEVKVTVIATGFGSDGFFTHEESPVAEPAEHMPPRTPVMAPNSPAGQRPVQAPSRPSIFGGKPRQAYQQETEELEPEPKAASGKSSDYEDDDLENTPAFLRRKKSF